MKGLKVIIGMLMITVSVVGIAAVKKAVSQKAAVKKTAVKNTSEKKEFPQHSLILKRTMLIKKLRRERQILLLSIVKNTEESQYL